jgi:hypothetical protein
MKAESVRVRAANVVGAAGTPARSTPAYLKECPTGRP